MKKPAKETKRAGSASRQTAATRETIMRHSREGAKTKSKPKSKTRSKPKSK